VEESAARGDGRDESRRVTRQSLRIKQEIGLRYALISPNSHRLSLRQLTWFIIFIGDVQTIIDDLIVSVAIPAGLGVRQERLTECLSKGASLGEFPRTRK